MAEQDEGPNEEQWKRVRKLPNAWLVAEASIARLALMMLTPLGVLMMDCDVDVGIAFIIMVQTSVSCLFELLLSYHNLFHIKSIYQLASMCEENLEDVIKEAMNEASKFTH